MTTVKIMFRKVFGKILPDNVKDKWIIKYIDRKACMVGNNKHINNLLASRNLILLELGAGSKRGDGDWVTSDISWEADLYIDLLNRFPFPNNSIDKIYSSHVFEHFSTSQLEFIIKECHRVLKRNGIISVCVPDAEIFIKSYSNPNAFDVEFFCRYKPGYNYYSKIDYLNYMAYMGGHHSHMFDKDNLIQMLMGNGFRNVKIRNFDPDIDEQSRDHESIYAQGEK